MDELDALLPHILAAPKSGARAEQLCLRPDYGARRFVDRIEVTTDRGIPGERWLTAPWAKLPDGAPDPRIQVSILGKRVVDAVWRDRINSPHPGDTIIADMDFSEANLPTGTRLTIGTAVLEVSDLFNDACVKWKTRYGQDAKDWLVRPEYRRFRLRGILCRIVVDGVIRRGDEIRRL